jgi:hypothetical protein
MRASQLVVCASWGGLGTASPSNPPSPFDRYFVPSVVVRSICSHLTLSLALLPLPANFMGIRVKLAKVYTQQLTQALATALRSPCVRPLSPPRHSSIFVSVQCSTLLRLLSLYFPLSRSSLLLYPSPRPDPHTLSRSLS